MASIDKILEKYWGYDSFRPLQREIIESILSGKDTIALMPTGGGKSITFQVSALAKKGICIVVTPLISLMKDQIDALRKRRIKAQVVHGGMTAREIDLVLDNCVYGDYKFLYVSPERLETELFRARMARMDVSMIAVDEAHCISQWGYDFRPAYLNIAKVRELAPDAPILAVTATATTEVVKDIEDKLLMSKPRLFRMSFARPNISYVVRNIEDKRSMILKIISALNGVGIIYCQTRNRCEEIAQFLKSQNIPADFYHGGMSHLLRGAKQEQWINEQIRIIVATNAFGMGIDKPNVRFVIHHDTPDTLEAYYQEAGRAGRDGLPSYAVLLTDKNDENSALQRVKAEYPSIDEIKQIYSLVCNYLEIAIGDGEGQSFDFNVYDFCSKFRFFSSHVVNALNVMQLCGYVTLTETINSRTRIHITASREELYRIQLFHSDLENFLAILMRCYTGLFSQFVAIDEKYLSHVSGYSIPYISDAFKKLGQLRVISYIPSKDTPLLIFNNERLAVDNIRIDANQYLLRKKQALKRLDSVFEYSSSNIKCRSLILQNYFGEECSESCGTCDICRARIKVERASEQRDYVKSVTDLIIKKLTSKPYDLKELMIEIKAPKSTIEESVKGLLDAKTIEFIPFDGRLRIRE
ncbi:MAG: ATP-dependent DNA helicase RecQ [Rikenellaceae bacterium]